MSSSRLSNLELPRATLRKRCSGLLEVELPTYFWNLRIAESYCILARAFPDGRNGIIDSQSACVTFQASKVKSTLALGLKKVRPSSESKTNPRYLGQGEGNMVSHSNIQETNRSQCTEEAGERVIRSMLCGQLQTRWFGSAPVITSCVHANIILPSLT